ncbi:uncharacterized protein LOC124117001 [Haliotis rufescens]|uniref:uncharacterized protein LOC124117001 n=1 Tax=Haliotis rufescens TaxID=6454 RepID=UPI00201F4D18|nr:uncharacterized protein LOC124117001 [Haliotis rufescens]
MFRDVPPVAPVTTIIPRSESLTDAYISNRKSTVDLPAIIPAIVLSPNEKAEPRFQKFESDKKWATPTIKHQGPMVGRSPTKNPTGNVLPRDDDAVSLVADDDITPRDKIVTPPRVTPKMGFKEKPLLVGGKVFDGVGFDDATDKPYVYNTKTGEVSYDVDKNDVRLTSDDTNNVFPSDSSVSTVSFTSTSSSTPSSTSRTIGSLPNLNTNEKPPSDDKPLKHNAARTSSHLDLQTGSLHDFSTALKNPRSAFTESIDSGLGEFNKQSNDSSHSSDGNATNTIPRRDQHGDKRTSWFIRTIPRDPGNKQDVLSRDPFYCQWAKGIAKRGKRPRPLDKVVSPGDVSSYISSSGDSLPAQKISTQDWMLEGSP